PRRLRVDLLLYSGGRDANSETLGCEGAGVDLARYGRLKASQDVLSRQEITWHLLKI
ncbi:unnamed protein product, partial [Laminaria digitata]